MLGACRSDRTVKKSGTAVCGSRHIAGHRGRRRLCKTSDDDQRRSFRKARGQFLYSCDREPGFRTGSLSISEPPGHLYNLRGKSLAITAPGQRTVQFRRPDLAVAQSHDSLMVMINMPSNGFQPRPEHFFEGEKDEKQRKGGINQLKELATVIGETSLCGLGKNAPSPLLSSMEKYPEDWDRHLDDRVCEAGVCRDLRTFFIIPDKCTGCFLCLNKCPEMAIVGSPRQVHVIIEDKCTGCGICQEVCMFNAIETR